MDTFVSGSLANQLRDLLALGAEDDDLDGAMQKIRDERERQFQAGLVKNGPKRQYKPRPDDWDSDMEGHWENSPNAVIANPASVPQASTGQRSVHAGPRPGTNRDDEDLSMDDFDSVQPVAKTTTARRPAATRTTKTAAPRQTATAAAKKTTAPKRGGGRKKGPFEDSDDSNADELMIDDEIEDNEQPQPARRSRAAPARPAGRMRQTTLQLSQPPRQQRPSRKATQQTQQSLELSDDEISDEDDFEPAPTTRARKR